MTKLRPGRPCCLYRHYDQDGALLYVGISKDPNRRTFEHAERSAWARYAVRMDGLWYSSWAAAEAAETAAILNEHPVFNAHMLGWADSVARRAEYERTHIPPVLPGREVDARPTRQSVAQGIRDQIAAGVMQPGEQVGTIKEVAAQWNLGFDSTMRVFSVLLDEGWFEQFSYKGRSFVTRSVPPNPPAERLTARAGKDVIAKHVREQIASGKLAPGDQVPSLKQLADLFETSVRSAQRAMEDLQTAGLVLASRGRRTIVADPDLTAHLDQAS